MNSDMDASSLERSISVLSGFPFPSAQFTTAPGKPLIRIRDLLSHSTGTNFVGEFDPTFLVQRDDILIGMDGDFSVVRWKGPEALLNQRVCKVSVIDSRIDNRFLYWWLQPHIAAIHRRTPQTTVRHLSVSDVYLIPRPPITCDRQAIAAAVLDTIDEAIAKTEAVIVKLKQIRAGLLHDLLTRGLDKHGQLRDPRAHPEQFQDSPLGWIPCTWQLAQLRTVANIASGVTLGRTLDEAGTLELPYLRVANVQDGYLDLADVKTIRIFPDELERFRLRYGDVLMNEGGDYDKLGRGTVWEDQIPVCLHQNHVFRVRCKPDVLNCYFLAAISGSKIGKRYFLQSSKQSTNLASINSTQLNAFEIPVPGLAEQEAIIKILKAQDDQLTTEARELAKLHAVKSGLMSDLLTGRVRVPEETAVAP